MSVATRQALAGPRRRAARRFIRTHSHTESDRLYHVYLALLMLVLVVGPALWITGSFFSNARAQTGLALEILGMVVAGMIAFGSLLPRAFTPVIATRTDVFYFVAGPFGAKATLATRTVLLVCAVALAGAAFATSAGIGLALPAAQTANLSALAAGGVVWLGGVLVGALTPHGARFRLSGVGVGVLCAAAALVSGATAPAWILLLLGIGLLFGVPHLLNTVPVGVFDATAMRRERVLASLYLGDAGGLNAGLADRYRAFRQLRMRFDGGPLANAVRVDVLEVLRNPLRLAAAVVLLIAASVLVLWPGANVLVLAGGLLLAQYSFTTLAKGLQDYLDTVGAERVLRQGFGATAARHLLVPLVAAVALEVIIGVVVILLRGAVNPAGCVLLLVLPVLSLLMFAGSAALPASALTPMPSASGDLSGVVMLIWLGRGLVPVALLVLLAPALSLTTAAGLVLLICGAGAARTLVKLARIERGMRGVAA